MKKRKKLLIILLLIIAVLGALAFWQRDNLKALYRAKTMDAEAILEEAAEQSKVRQKELDEYDVRLKMLTRKEMDTLLDGGSIAQDEDAPAEETLPTDPDAAKKIIERCIQELYDCEVALMSRLGTMKREALNEWHALPEEQRTKEKKLEIGYRGLDACYNLEVEIDAQVQGILAKYRAELESINADAAPMDTLWKHYCEEKVSAKAYYLNKYL